MLTIASTAAALRVSPGRLRRLLYAHPERFPVERRDIDTRRGIRNAICVPAATVHALREFYASGGRDENETTAPKSSGAAHRHMSAQKTETADARDRAGSADDTSAGDPLVEADENLALRLDTLSDGLEQLQRCMAAIDRALSARDPEQSSRLVEEIRREYQQVQDLGATILHMVERIETLETNYAAMDRDLAKVEKGARRQNVVIPPESQPPPVFFSLAAPFHRLRRVIAGENGGAK